MTLTSDDGLDPAVRVLLERAGLVPPGGGRVVTASRQRHDTALVDDERGAFWFVKRRGPPLVSGEISLSRELAVHRLLRMNKLPRALADHLARLVAEDEATETLVFSGIVDHLDLRAVVRDAAIDIDSLCAGVGSALGIVHGEMWGTSLPFLRPLENPVQTHGRITPELVAHGPRCSFELLRLLQSEPSLNEQLRDLRASWRRATLIHGDLKSDNIVVPRPITKPVLIDWELAGIGDPAWDCGSLLGSLCFQWLESMRPGMDSTAAAQARRRALGAFHAFWETYERERRSRTHEFDSEREANATFRWAGYWLLQRVMILLPLHRVVTALDVSVLHLASQLLGEGAQGRPPP